MKPSSQDMVLALMAVPENKLAASGRGSLAEVLTRLCAQKIPDPAPGL